MSEPYALLIVGGGPAGLAAARAFRGASGVGKVAIVADEHRVPYERPPLTKELLRGESSEEALPIEPESWLAHQRVDLVAGRVVALDPGRRVASLSGGRELPYETCVLATGAEPTRLPVPGADHPRVLVIRTLDHVRELTARLGDGDPLVVIGSGFIGCEIASSLRIRGHPVELVSDERAPNAERLGEEAAEIIATWLAQDGVGLHFDSAVERIEPADGSATVRVGSEQIVGKLVVMAAGVSPRAELAVQVGLELVDGAIPAAADMHTAQVALLAAGDVCRADNLSAGRPLRVEHWGDALGQGEIAGKTAAGERATWSAVPGFWSTIGRRTLKYAAWGDGFDRARLRRGSDGAFTTWYGKEDRLVGVLTHDADADYEHGAEQIARGERWPW
jgi:3-phenylpropionate/trans-cinnamate dioxygenase ferredoxin reductase component